MVHCEATEAQEALLNMGREVSQTHAGGSGDRSWPEMEELRASHCFSEGQEGESGIALQWALLVLELGMGKKRSRVNRSKPERRVLRNITNG